MRLDFARMQGRKFLEGIIDYAGLFPPASLGMPDAVSAYASYRSGPDRDLLGRFIVPAGRLDEFAKALGHAPPARERWQVSVIGKEFAETRDLALDFNARESRATCDAIEIPVASAHEVERVLAQPQREFELFLEIPVAPDPTPVVAAIAGSPAFAKIRTGGITASAIPSSEEVLRFLSACLTFRVPFKATAGLHHAVRSEYPLTYERDAACGTMFGYLNIFLAAAALEDGWTTTEALEILEQRDVTAFRFDDDGAVVNGRPLSGATLHAARSTFARSFGSCSFVEPVEEARAAGLI
jgi:hypothetical protein